MKLDIDITDSVRQIPAYQDTLGVRVCCDSLDVKVLACIVLDAGQEDQSRGRGMGVDGGEDLIRSDESVRSRLGLNKDHRVFRLEAMMSYLGLDSILQA